MPKPSRSKYSAWKELERRARKYFPGGERLWRPDFSDSQPDGQNDTDTWDAKCYERHSCITLYQDCEKKYRQFTGLRRFTLVLYARQRKSAGDFVLCRAADWRRLLDIEQKAKEAGLVPESD